MTATLTGFKTTGCDVDNEGYRTYKLTSLVETDDKNDGPFTVLNCPDLAAWGSPWIFGNDYDPWAYCYPTTKVSIYSEKEGDPVYQWAVEQTFSNKPLKRCQDTKIEDPLLEPQKVSGGWVKRSREATYDRFGQRILSSSFEQLRGNPVEFDENGDTVTIEQNVAILELPVFTFMKDCVNSAPLWGMAARTIKLGKVSWERKILGICGYYYTRTFEFEVNANTWDRDVPDEGDKVLDGHWEKNATTGDWEWQVRFKNPAISSALISASDPRNFIRAKDPHDQPCHVQLNGSGVPLKFGDAPAKIHVEKYDEADFLLLGIPTVIGI